MSVCVTRGFGDDPISDMVWWELSEYFVAKAGEACGWIRGSGASVLVKFNPLQGESPRLEPDMAALVGLVSAEPKDVFPNAVHIPPFLCTQDAGGLAGFQRLERDHQSSSGENEF